MNSVRIVVAAGVCAAAAWGRAAEPAPPVWMTGLREKIAADPQLAEARAKLDAAEKAVADTVARDPEIAAAGKAEQDARDAAAKAEVAAVDGDPRVQEQRRALAAARTRAAELELDRRLQETRAEHLRAQVRSQPEFAAAIRLAHPADDTLHRKDARLAAARKALDEANAALEAKVRELPEHAARERARVAHEQAVAASAAVQEAIAARREIDRKIAADERVSAQVAKVTAAADAVAAQRRTIEDIDRKIAEASREAAAKNPQVAAAAQAVAAAQARTRTTTEQRTADQRRARDAAQETWRGLVEAAIAGHPDATKLMTEIGGLEERLRQLRDQAAELRRPLPKSP